VQPALKWPDADWSERTRVVAKRVVAAGSRRPRLWSGLGLGVLLLALLCLFWNWDWVRGPVARAVGARLHREVHIDGHLRVRLLTLTPQVTVEGLRIGQPAWAGRGDMIQAPRLLLRAKLLPLFIGRLEMPLVEVDRPVLNLAKDTTGRVNWSFSSSTRPPPLKLPPIQDLWLRDGRLKMDDASRRLHLTGAIEARQEGGPTVHGGLVVTAHGSLNGEPVKLVLTGGPFVGVREDRPYPFTLKAVSGGTAVEAQGAIDHPFDLGHYHADLDLKGSDLSQLYALTTAPLPDTPPYHLRGQFSRDGETYAFRNFSGVVGVTDLAGTIVSSRPGARRLLTADLASRSLDWKDLATMLGTGPKASKAATPEQKAAARTVAASGRLFPTTTLDVERLRASDARFRFHAASVKLNAIKLTAVTLDGALLDGVLTVDPLAFSFAQGGLTGKVRIDARPEVPITDLDLKLSDYDLQSLIPARGGTPTVTGRINGRARLHGVGASVHAAAARASGEIQLFSPQGEVRKAFAELLGMNVGRGLYLLLSKSGQQTPLNCAVADFQVRDGVLTPDPLVIDTGVVTARGEGSIDLGAETLNLKLDGKAKEPDLLHLWSPITIKGHIGHPQLGVEKGPLIRQGVVAAAGAVLDPFVALLPFLSPGHGHPVDCSRLLARVGASPARR
jgi:uncharacterized protein involved in outer membrane biogenesis